MAYRRSIRNQSGKIPLEFIAAALLALGLMHGLFALQADLGLSIKEQSSERHGAIEAPKFAQLFPR